MKVRPGEAFDSKGVPIYPGDLLRSFHFRGARRNRYWLYHIAMWNEKHETMEMVPVREAAGLGATGGRCWITRERMDGEQTTIIDGKCVRINGKECLDVEDRPKRKAVKV